MDSDSAVWSQPLNYTYEEKIAFCFGWCLVQTLDIKSPEAGNMAKDFAGAVQKEMMRRGWMRPSPVPFNTLVTQIIWCWLSGWE